MFISTKDQGARRPSRPYGSSKTARSSKLSLLSAVTTTSSGSGGSTSTVTPDSYSRSRRDPSKRIKKKRKSRDGDSKMKKDSARPSKLGEKPAQVPSTTRRPQAGASRSVDVFEFLVEDGVGKEKGKATAPASTMCESDRGSKNDVEQAEELEQSDHSDQSESDQSDQSDQSDPECYYRSHFSDSGISMGSSTGEPSRKPALPPLIEEPIERLQNFTPSVPDSLNYQSDPQMTWGHVPTGFLTAVPHSPTSVRSFPASSEYQLEHRPHSPVSTRSYAMAPDSQGKDIPLASSEKDSISCLESAPIVFRRKGDAAIARLPVFRNFSSVNTRMLLQMQANIAELEHQLTLLDAKTVSAESPKLARGDTGKASHRSAKDHARRTEIYQELHLSLDQYYQALSATHQISQITSPSTNNDTQFLKQWLQSHVSPNSNIQPLTGDGSDLIRLKEPIPDIETSPFLTSLHIIALSILFNTFVPLVVFKLMTSILDRLIVWSMLIAAGAMAMEKSDIQLNKVHRNCTIAFAGISFCAALFL